ncbi:MAG: YcxB family protein [Clostridiaceae bacterium]|nr:YcxB family protein [Clostridiaceae bacterium]
MDSTMKDTVKINIKYRLKDIKEYSFAKTYSGIGGKLLLLTGVLWLIFMIISLPGIVFLCILDIYSLLNILPTYLLIILIVCAIEFLPLLVDYLVSRNSFMKSKLLQSINCLEFSRDNYKIYSAEGISSLLWEEVYKIRETRRFFLLYLSPLKVTVIPKRCFQSQEEIEDLRIIFKDCLPKKKLKLKNYKFKNFSPDYGEVEFKNESHIVEENNKGNFGEEPELIFEFTLEKRELLVAYFTLLYTKPMGIITTLIGLFFIIINVINFEIDSPRLIFMLIGIVLVFLMPIMLFVMANKGYNNDPLIQKPIKYIIYKDYYSIDHPSGMSHMEFAKLVKIDETKSVILLYVTTQLFHVIPKRVFEGKEDDLLKLKEILSKYRKKRR